MTKQNEIIESYNEYIKKVPSGCQIIADKLRADEVVEAMKGVIAFSEGANWLSSACSFLKEKNVQVILPTEKIHEYLNEVNRGLEIQDYVAVADMFEYEIQPFFYEYSQEIELIQ